MELYGRNSDFILALYSILKLICAGIISFGSYPTMCQGISQDRQPSRRIIWNSLMGLPGVEFIPAHPRTQRVAYLRKILFLQSVKFTSCRSEFDPGRRDWPRGVLPNWIKTTPNRGHHDGQSEEFRQLCCMECETTRDSVWCS